MLVPLVLPASAWTFHDSFRQFHQWNAASSASYCRTFHFYGLFLAQVISFQQQPLLGVFRSSSVLSLRQTLQPPPIFFYSSILCLRQFRCAMAQFCTSCLLLPQVSSASDHLCLHQSIVSAKLSLFAVGSICFGQLSALTLLPLWRLCPVRYFIFPTGCRLWWF